MANIDWLGEEVIERRGYDVIRLRWRRIDGVG
jgi:hypothetical protein